MPKLLTPDTPPRLWGHDESSGRLPRSEGESTLVPPAVATYVALLLVGLVPILVVVVTPVPRFSGWGPIAVIIFCGVRFAWLTGRGQQRLAEMSFWLFTYAFLGLAPLVQFRTGDTPATTPGVDYRLNAAAVVVVLIGIAFACIGMAAKSRHLRGRTMTVSSSVAPPTGARVYALTVCALLVTAYYVATLGPAALFSSRESLVRQQSDIWPDPAVRMVIIASATMPLLVAVVALWSLRKQRGKIGRPQPWLIPWTATIALLLVVNPISSPRYVFGTVLLAVLTALGMCSTRNRFRVVAMSALAGIVMVFPAADLFRYSGTAQVKSSNILESLTSPDFDAFSQINNSVRFVEREGVHYGEQMLGVAFFWVPRSVWPDKPVGTGPLLAASQGYQVSNLSAPLWAEFYVDGSWLALCVGMFAAGWWIRRSDERTLGSLTRDETPGILPAILSYYLIILLRGDLMQAMSYLLVILLAAFWVKDRALPRPRRRSREKAQPLTLMN